MSEAKRTNLLPRLSPQVPSPVDAPLSDFFWKKRFSSLFESACAGHFPLFLNGWIKETYGKEAPLLTLHEAETHAYQRLEKLESYESLAKKLTIIDGMRENERDNFIYSFMRVVESKTLDRTTALH